MGLVLVSFLVCLFGNGYRREAGKSRSVVVWGFWEVDLACHLHASFSNGVMERISIEYDAVFLSAAWTDRVCMHGFIHPWFKWRASPGQVG